MSATPIAQSHNIQAYTYWDSPVPANLAGQNFTDPVIFNPTTFTLITTSNEAVLVDTPTVRSRAEAVADWIAEIIEGRKLSTIYITHGHGDHFFGADVIQERFPDAVIRATQGTYEHMQEQLSPAFWDGFWVPTFPELQESPKPNLTIEALPKGKDRFFVDGHEFRAVEVLGGDTASSTVLYVPALDLVVGGDVVYGGCYQYLAENTTPELRQKWIAAVDQVAKLHPKVVVPSHRLSTDGFELDHLKATQEYIRTWSRLDAETTTWQEMEAAVVKAYPKRIGNFILRLSELDRLAVSPEEFLIISWTYTPSYIMSTPSPFTNKDTFAAAIHAAFNCPDSDLEGSLLNLYTKQSIITVNQDRMSWDDFVPYIEAIRARTTSVDIECHHLIRDGNMFAERHTARGMGQDGTITKAEALLLGELNEDGKAIWLEEIAILSSDSSHSARK
ncbi:beta-lactamase-like protein [Trichoderma longibrachiatum]